MTSPDPSPITDFKMNQSLKENVTPSSLGSSITGIVGDYQFDIYRQMRAILTNENETKWQDYKPATNVLWLHYLANKLLYGKQLPTPVMRLSARNQFKQAQRRGPERSFSVILEGEDKDAYEGLLNIYNRINPKHTEPLGSATEVLALGEENAWIA